MPYRIVTASGFQLDFPNATSVQEISDFLDAAIQRGQVTENGQVREYNGTAGDPGTFVFSYEVNAPYAQTPTASGFNAPTSSRLGPTSSDYVQRVVEAQQPIGGGVGFPSLDDVLRSFGSLFERFARGGAPEGQPPRTIAGLPAIPGGGASMGLSALIERLPAVVVDIIRSVGGRWTALPGWVRTLLINLGVLEGTNIVIDDLTSGGGGDGMPAIPQGGTMSSTGVQLNPFVQMGDGSYYNPQHGMVTGAWQANGVPFVKFADGWEAAYAPTKQSWKFFKPKKPIVLYTNGAKNPETAVRAYKALKKQAKDLRPLVDQFAPRRTRTRKARVVGDIVNVSA